MATVNPLMQVNEFTPQVQGIERQRKMAEILMQQGLQQPQGQMVSGHYVAPSWSQNLAGLANIAAGNYMQNQAEQKQMDLANALRGKQQEAVQNYFGALQGTPDTERVFAADVGPSIETIKGQAPDYAKAFQIATGEYAPQYLSQMAIERMKPFDLEEGKIRYQINPTTGKQEIVAQGGEKKSNEMRNYEQAVKQGFNGTFPQYEIMLKKAGASNVHVSLPPAESEWAKTFGAGVGKQDLALKDIADNSKQVINTVQTQRKLLDSSNLYTGFGAEQKLDLARLGVALGVGGKNAEQSVQNTQQLMAGRASATLDAIKSSGLGSGTGFSNADRDFLEKAKMGGITYDKTALQRQLALEEKVARMGTETWNNRLKTMPKSAIPLNVSPVELPAPLGEVDSNNPLLNSNRR